MADSGVFRRSRTEARVFDAPAAATGPGSRPRLADLDARLVGGVAQTRRELTCVATEHDAPAGSRCPMCGWQTTWLRPVCRSAAAARAVRDRRALPPWLSGLAVPGLWPQPRRNGGERVVGRGLFVAPARQGRWTA